MGGRNGILVLNVSSLSLNGHLFHLEVGKGFYFKKRKSEIILMPSWVAGQRMMWGEVAFGNTRSSFCPVS